MDTQHHQKAGRRTIRSESAAHRGDTGASSRRRNTSRADAKRQIRPVPAPDLPQRVEPRVSRQLIPVLWTQDLFAIAEHRRVQRSIEARAHEIWRNGGRPAGQALGHWLAAEDEVLMELARDPGRLMPLHPAFWGM